MTFEVYDYRSDVRNILVTPEIRSRFLKVEPGSPSGTHTHDLGHEVFLVLEGLAAFDIDGITQQVGPGQMCVALAGQMHGVRALGDQSMTMYLSVTPHVQPTHTFWDALGRRLPHHFAPSSNYDTETDTTTPIQELLDKLIAATDTVAKAAIEAAEAQRQNTLSVPKNTSGDNLLNAEETRITIYDALLPLFQSVSRLQAVWNDVAPRTGPVN